MGEFVSFRKFITPVVVQVMFWLGVIAIIAGTVIAIVTEGRLGDQPQVAVHPIVSLIGGIILLFIWRMWCELVILSFKIYDELRTIGGNTRR